MRLFVKQQTCVILNKIAFNFRFKKNVGLFRHKNILHFVLLRKFIILSIRMNILYNTQGLEKVCISLINLGIKLTFFSSKPYVEP